MTPDQVMLVKSSWEKLIPIADTAAELFYNKLFALDPELRELFTGNMIDQGRKLMTMINTAVNGLDRLSAIVPAVEELGARHATYGVKDEDYDTVCEALLWTLGTGLGDDFTPEVKAAWSETYNTLADTMKAAARQPA
jgi:hemoglobin-like flavoprotein